MNYNSVPELIRLRTYYHDNKLRRRLSFHSLLHLIEKIEEQVLSQGTDLPAYIRITPFYENKALKDSVFYFLELDKYILYIECRENISAIERKQFESCGYECINSVIHLSESENKHKKLINYSEKALFVGILKDYLLFLEKSLLPKAFLQIKAATSALDEKMCLGEFSFEIHCR